MRLRSLKHPENVFLMSFDRGKQSALRRGGRPREGGKHIYRGHSLDSFSAVYTYIAIRGDTTIDVTQVFAAEVLLSY